MSATATNLNYQVYNRRLGLWIFMISESVIFFTLLVSRFYMDGFNRPHAVNQTLGLIITMVLLVSSFFANRAEIAIVHGDLSGFKTNLIVTLLLGTGFLAGVVAYEWPMALKEGMLPSTAYGTSLFALTGMHAFHVLTGLLILTLALVQGIKGKLKEDHWAAEGAIIYWHFVDVVWVFVYPVLYLVGPLSH